MDWITWTEVLSYIVTVVGLPFAIIVFVHEQQKERENEEEALYQNLSDSYASFLALVLENADLQLLSKGGTPQELTEEQQERRLIIFEMLIALFERAYILVYEEHMSAHTQRLWRTWDDYMRYWCRRQDFREALPMLIEGEDADFSRYILAVLADEMAKR